MKKITVFWVTWLSLFLAIATMATFTFARFLDTYADSPQLVAPSPFYFESTLAEGQTYYVAAGEDLVFTVRNHDTLSHVTKEALSFDVAINGTQLSTHTCTANIADNKTVTVPAAQLGAVGSIKSVTLTSSTPYVQAITFHVKVVVAEAVNCYSVADKGDYVQLDLYTGSTLPSHDITVNYGELAPDSTGALTSTWMTEAGSATIPVSSLLPYSHYTLYFFGRQPVSAKTNAALTATITLG